MNEARLVKVLDSLFIVFAFTTLSFQATVIALGQATE
jgi:hypothetical protein